MFSLAFSASITGTETCTFISGSRLTNDGIWLKRMKQFRPGNRCRPGIVARIKKGKKHEYPWPDNIDPNLKSGHLSYLSDFKPLAEKPKPITLGFEKPLIDLEKKIMDVRKMADETGLDFTDQINSLEEKYQQALKDLYKHITPFQRLQIARHPNRPTSLDHILKMTDMWVELHGDRAGYDDPALVTGIGRMDGEFYVFIAHQKGRNTKENIKRNFGMPTPHGYRKALRMMRYAEHHGFPIITLIDTPGAFPDLKCEQLGQGEAIAFNLREMFGIKVPIVTVVLGEGGSGGALAIGCGNKLLMLENAVFYVASPEACSVILWKSTESAPLAAEKLKITAEDLYEHKICDVIIPEPLGGAHTDPSWMSQQLKIAIKDAMKELTAMDTETLLKHRHDKYRNIGGFTEGEFVEPELKRNMKKKEVGVSDTTDEIEHELENFKITQETENDWSSFTISEEAMERMIEELDKEMKDAFVSMGLQEKIEAIESELSKSDTTDISPELKEKVDGLAQEFKQNLSKSNGSYYIELMKKLEIANRVNKLKAKREKSERLEKEINEKLKGPEFNEKFEILKVAREKVAQGELLDDSEMEKVEMAKKGLADMVKSLNFKFVGYGRRNIRTCPPNLEGAIETLDAVTKMEIEKAVMSSNMRGKIDLLKEMLRNNTASLEEVRALHKEIREAISAAMDLPGLTMKLENRLAIEFPLSEEQSVLGR